MRKCVGMQLDELHLLGKQIKTFLIKRIWIEFDVTEWFSLPIEEIGKINAGGLAQVTLIDSLRMYTWRLHSIETYQFWIWILTVRI